MEMHHVLAAIALMAPLQTAAPSGVFTDRAGVAHVWSVSANRGLTWDGQPFTPVGVWFTPRCLSVGATEENLSHDADLLRTLKASGVGDVIVDPVVSAAAPEAADWQRVVDLLEEHGMRYGIAFGGGIDTQLTGMLVNPSAFRITGVHDGMDIAWDAPNADHAWFLVTDARDGTQISMEGRIPVRNGQVGVSTTARVTDGSVAILYPRVTLGPPRSGMIPDVWSGFDRFRDRLLLTLGQVRFGPGLRFFLDPLGPPIAPEGDADHFVPDSPSFRLEWEAFLARKYPSIGSLATAWSLMDRDLRDHRAASGLVPLWSRSKGVPFLLDLAEGKRYQIGGGESKFWADLHECRDTSLSYAMAAMADFLKREIAGVPVVFTHTGLHRVFASTSAPGGWDGLSAPVSGQGTTLRMGTVGAALSRIADAGKPLWFLTTVGDRAAADAAASYTTRDALNADLDRLRAVGARGIFVRIANLGAASEDVLASLAAYSSRAATAVSPGASPRVLPYPTAAAGLVTTGRIGSGGVWWVPSLSPGRALDFGASYAGYTIKLPEGESMVLWSLKGPRDTRLHVADPRKVQAFEPDGQALEVKIDVKGRTARLVIGPTPVVIRTGGQDVFPMEAVEDALRELRIMVAEAQAQKLPAQDFRYRLDTAEARYRHKDMATAFLMCTQALAGIVEMMQPYSWREAEYATVQTFTEVVPDPGASAQMYLALNGSAPPPRDGYTLQLDFRVPADDTYDVWLACTPPSTATSPFAWIVDAGETQMSTSATVVGSTYSADRLVWMKLGRVPLKPGGHTFTLRVTDRAEGTNAYALAVDALLVTRGPFTPRGTTKPQAVPTR